jgi:hypothetical protein
MLQGLRRVKRRVKAAERTIVSSNTQIPLGTAAERTIVSSNTQIPLGLLAPTYVKPHHIFLDTEKRSDFCFKEATV